MAQQVVIRCLCGQLTETVQLRDKIPVPGSVCHCNICRHVTGAMTFSGVSLLSPPAELFKSKLVRYATSEKIIRYFCETCGSHVCYNSVQDDRWAVCPGAIDEVLGEYHGKLEEYTGQEFIADTQDGGLCWCFPNIPNYMEEDGVAPVPDVKSELDKLHLRDSDGDSQGTMEAECHCGEVKFSIRAEEDGKKWEAGLCACRSCRLAFSQFIVAWALNIPRDRIVWPDGSSFDARTPQSLKVYQSSDHVQRYFCSKCGASVAYEIAKQPGKVDIAFGILRAREGSLARSIFKWNTKKIYHMEDAIDKELVAGVMNNLEALEKA